MSPDDPTLQENRTEETSVSSEASSRPNEHSPENSAPPQSGQAAGALETSAPPPPAEETPAAEASETPAEAQAAPQQPQGEIQASETAPAAPEPPSDPPPAAPPIATTTPPTVIAAADQAPPPSAETPSPDDKAEPEAAAETSPLEQAAQTNAVEASPTEASSTESPATETPPAETSPRSRVTLDRSAGEQAKPVPSLSEKQGEEAVPESGSEETARPSAPVRGIEIPRSADLDPAMEQELNAALADPAGAAPGTPQAVNLESLEPGAKLKGTVQLVGEETVFIDLGLRSPGMIPTRQFPEGKRPEPGQELEVVIDKIDLNAGTVAVHLPRARHKVAGNWDAVAKGQVVDAMVTKTNKGGLEVTVSSLRGFLPASQVDLGFVEDLEAYIGQKLTCVITEVNPQKRNLVLSRRAFLQEERKEREKEFWQSLAPGQQHEGTVKTIKDYGAFVDLGGVDGFLHVGEISWNRIHRPSDVLTVGQTIQVSILKLDPESRKIGLGMKQLQANPWADVEQKYPLGSTVSGKVTRTADFGAFVEVEEGVEGLVHISELDHRRVGRVTEVVNLGDEVDVKVLAVEPNRRRISLSLKALKSKPEAEKTAAPEIPPYERKRKEPLRGGRESQESSSSGLFGNPKDYQ